MATIISGDTGIDKITDGSVVNADLASGIDAAKLTGTLPALDGSSLTNLPASGPTLKYVTDTTDIAVTALPTAGYYTIGSTFSVDIPTSGYIEIKNEVMKITSNSAAYSGPAFGLRIGSTNYWLSYVNNNGTIHYLPPFITENPTTGVYKINYSYTNGVQFGSFQIRDIIDLGIPTGTQTVQLIVAKNTFWTGDFTINGTTVTTRVGIQFTSVS